MRSVPRSSKRPGEAKTASKSSVATGWNRDLGSDLSASGTFHHHGIGIVSRHFFPFVARLTADLAAASVPIMLRITACTALAAYASIPIVPRCDCRQDLVAIAAYTSIPVMSRIVYLLSHAANSAAALIPYMMRIALLAANSALAAFPFMLLVTVCTAFSARTSVPYMKTERTFSRHDGSPYSMTISVGV